MTTRVMNVNHAEMAYIMDLHAHCSRDVKFNEWEWVSTMRRQFGCEPNVKYELRLVKWGPSDTIMGMPACSRFADQDEVKP